MQLGVKFLDTYILDEILKDLTHSFETVASDLHLTIFGHKIKIQNYLIIGVVKFKFELSNSLVLRFFIFAHVHEETLT